MLYNTKLDTLRQDKLHNDKPLSLSATYLNYDDETNVYNYIQEYLESSFHKEESIYFLDIGEIERLYHLWCSRFPGIHPYYAIKCNPDTGFIHKLQELGANFDCASIAEIDRVLSLGVSPDRIIFANPCKRQRDIVAAYQKGVQIVTFDTETELIKIAQVCPKMNVMLRIYAKDPDARCQFAHKFGAEKYRWQQLIETAVNNNINIMGISFHVGSGASSPKAYALAIKEARDFYDMATERGFKIQIVDIGGGFTSSKLGEIPEAIVEAKNMYFPDDLGCRFIAEPGRFFAETSGYLATNIIGIRKTENTRDYWITDSLYGSFNCIFYDHYTPLPEYTKEGRDNYFTTLYGPTCDGLDKILELESYPEMELNEWLIFKNMGAYTLAGACNFNGIPFLNTHIVYLLQNKSH